MADRQINVEALTAYASESLAHYMVPDVFIQLEKNAFNTEWQKLTKKHCPSRWRSPET